MLQVHELRKRYGETLALDGVSFEVERGQFFGLLGPNGAGKSTAIAIVVGILEADSGSVTVEGQPISTGLSEAREKIGYVPQEIALFEDLNSLQNLQLFGALYRLSGEQLDRSIKKCLEIVSLQDRQQEPIKNFSGGMRRRLNIAVALLHDPDLIVLDEPTVGIDPQSRNAIFDTLEALRTGGKTLIYTTHYMEEVERLCDKIAIIDHGRVIANGTLSELYQLLPTQNKVVVTLADQVDAERARGILSNIGLLTPPLLQGSKIDLEPKDFALGIADIATALNKAQIRFTDLTSQKATLEEVFLHSTGRSLRDV